MISAQTDGEPTRRRHLRDDGPDWISRRRMTTAFSSHRGADIVGERFRFESMRRRSALKRRDLRGGRRDVPRSGYSSRHGRSAARTTSSRPRKRADRPVSCTESRHSHCYDVRIVVVFTCSPKNNQTCTTDIYTSRPV